MALIEKIVGTFRAFQTVKKYAFRATPQEIAAPPATNYP